MGGTPTPISADIEGAPDQPRLPDTPASGTQDLESRADASRGITPSTSAPGTTEDLESRGLASHPEASITLQPAPNVVRPKRGGLAGVVDTMLDDLAGTKGQPKVETDQDGNKYLSVPTKTRGQQWFKIIGEALEGAAAGAAAKPGPGQLGRAAQAGVEAGQGIADRTRQQNQEMSQEVRQANIDRANQAMLKLKMGAQEFELARLKVKASQDDIDFAQRQEDRLAGLVKEGKAFDLGTYANEGDLAEVQKQHPEFWKSFNAGDITGVPVIGPNGERHGMHVYLTTPGVGNEPEDGQQFHVFTPPVKPGDKPTMTLQTASGPMSPNQAHAMDLAAYTQMQAFQANIANEEYKKAQTGATNAEAAERRANTAKIQKETAQMDETGVTSPLVQDVMSGNIVPERLSYMLARKDGQQFLESVAQAARASGTPFDSSKLQSYPKMYNDFVSGKTSQQMRNLNTALQHTQDLRNLNTMTSRIAGTKDARAFDNKLESVSAEVANALAKPGATATKDEIHNVKASLAPIVNREKAIDTQIGSMIEQYRTLRNVWKEGAPSAVYEAKMPDLSPEAKSVVIRYAPQDAAQWWHKPQGATMAVPSRVDGQLRWSDGKIDLGPVQ